MVGDQRKYTVTVFTVKAIGANGELAYADELDPLGKWTVPGVTTITAARSNQEWIKKITEAITATSNELKACLENTFKIQKFTIM